MVLQRLGPWVCHTATLPPVMAAAPDVRPSGAIVHWLIRGGASEVTAEIYRQHGDALFEKRAYDQADLPGLCTEGGSMWRVIEGQRIPHLQAVC